MPHKDFVKELKFIRMSLRAVRDRVNGDLDALEKQLQGLIPDEGLRPRARIDNWKKAANDLFGSRKG